MSSVSTFGMAVFGDAATIACCTQINILGASPTNASCLLDIVDCTNHMSVGGIRRMLIALSRNSCL